MMSDLNPVSTADWSTTTSALVNPLRLENRNAENEIIRTPDFRLPAHAQSSSSADLQLSPTFFVLAHPVFIVLVPYGLTLTFASWLAPTLIPAAFPLGLLAKYLGTNFNLLMGVLAIIAGSLHVSEAVYAVQLSLDNRFTGVNTVRWGLNTLFFGIFGFWPLLKPEVFREYQEEYCKTTLCIQ